MVINDGIGELDYVFTLNKTAGEIIEAFCNGDKVRIVEDIAADETCSAVTSSIFGQSQAFTRLTFCYDLINVFSGEGAATLGGNIALVFSDGQNQRVFTCASEEDYPVTQRSVGAGEFATLFGGVYPAESGGEEPSVIG